MRALMPIACLSGLDSLLQKYNLAQCLPLCSTNKAGSAPHPTTAAANNRPWTALDQVGARCLQVVFINLPDGQNVMKTARSCHSFADALDNTVWHMIAVKLLTTVNLGIAGQACTSRRSRERALVELNPEHAKRICLQCDLLGRVNAAVRHLQSCKGFSERLMAKANTQLKKATKLWDIQGWPRGIWHKGLAPNASSKADVLNIPALSLLLPPTVYREDIRMRELDSIDLEDHLPECQRTHALTVRARALLCCCYPSQ